MTTTVIVVAPETPARKIAKILLDNGISAVPVVGADGDLLGMVSEGDLLGRRQEERNRRRDWWLALLAEGGFFKDEIVAQLQSNELTAEDLMSTPVVTVSESTFDTEIAALLSKNKIKRVPVIRDGKVVGIVSRADLVLAQSGQWKPRDAATPRA
ncbi:MAG TPA: CBS domain-containing protein [Candidatus Udaeobacter sp.]|nr:CBS domain-containing protein [Candidatus Udaeobacter sp.]